MHRLVVGQPHRHVRDEAGEKPRLGHPRHRGADRGLAADRPGGAVDLEREGEPHGRGAARGQRPTHPVALQRVHRTAVAIRKRGGPRLIRPWVSETPPPLSAVPSSRTSSWRRVRGAGAARGWRLPCRSSARPRRGGRRARWSRAPPWGQRPVVRPRVAPRSWRLGRPGPRASPRASPTPARAARTAAIRRARSRPRPPARGRRAARPAARAPADQAREHRHADGDGAGEAEREQEAVANVAAGSQPVDERERPAGVGGPVDRSPAAMADPGADQAGDDEGDQQVERERAEAEPHRAVARAEGDDRVHAAGSARTGRARSSRCGSRA